jgi:hypothetical protein
MNETEFKPGAGRTERDPALGDSVTKGSEATAALRDRLKPCRRGCPKATLNITVAGYFRDGTIVIECGTCQYATPVLFPTDAAERWERDNANREAGGSHGREWNR